jgi:hypothetical protein
VPVVVVDAQRSPLLQHRPTVLALRHRIAEATGICETTITLVLVTRTRSASRRRRRRGTVD